MEGRERRRRRRGGESEVGERGDVNVRERRGEGRWEGGRMLTATSIVYLQHLIDNHHKESSNESLLHYCSCTAPIIPYTAYRHSKQACTFMYYSNYPSYCLCHQNDSTDWIYIHLKYLQQCLLA